MSLAGRLLADAALPPTTVGARPTARALLAWSGDDAVRARLEEFVAVKRAVRPGEALLCVLWWLERYAGDPPAGDRRAAEQAAGAEQAARPDVRRSVSASEVSTRYPRHGGRRISAASTLLRRAAEAGLCAADGGGWYRTTPLGTAVVEALPDRRRAAALRGVRLAARQRG